MFHPLTIIPNPATTAIRIAGRNEIPCTWKIINSEGKELIAGTLDDMSNAIDVSMLPAGIYHLYMTARTGSQPFGYGTFVRLDRQ